jgi:hypothetical protein
MLLADKHLFLYAVDGVFSAFVSGYAIEYFSNQIVGVVPAITNYLDTVEMPLPPTTISPSRNNFQSPSSQY